VHEAEASHYECLPLKVGEAQGFMNHVTPSYPFGKLKACARGRTAKDLQRFFIPFRFIQNDTGSNERYLRVNAFQIRNVPQLGCLGGAKGAGIEAMFAGIPVAFVATALAFNLCLVCSHVLGNLTRGT